MGINQTQKSSPGHKNFSKKSRDPKLGVISWTLHTIMSVMLEHWKEAPMNAGRGVDSDLHSFRARIMLELTWSAARAHYKKRTRKRNYT